MADWGTGSYERTARMLEPAAEVALAVAGVRRGERVLDVGCGTGNAALAAARAGARVVGVDPAERLLSVARDRLAAAGLEGELRTGGAENLPVADGAFDAVLSVFGAIFADDPDAAAREMVRATAEGGRVVVTSWVPDGPFHQIGELVREAFGRPPQPTSWGTEEALSERFDGHEIHVREESIAFRAPSPADYLDEQLEHHPMWLDAEAPLRRTGAWDEVVEQVRATFREANEDPGAFRLTSRYLVTTVRP